jgi:hypothetical protein
MLAAAQSRRGPGVPRGRWSGRTGGRCSALGPARARWPGRCAHRRAAGEWPRGAAGSGLRCGHGAPAQLERPAASRSGHHWLGSPALPQRRRAGTGGAAPQPVRRRRRGCATDASGLRPGLHSVPHGCRRPNSSRPGPGRRTGGPAAGSLPSARPPQYQPGAAHNGCAPAETPGGIPGRQQPQLWCWPGSGSTARPGTPARLAGRPGAGTGR